MHDHDVHAQGVLIGDVLAVMRAWHPDWFGSAQERHVRSVLEAHVAGPRQGDLFAPPPPREPSRVARAVTRMLRGDDPSPDPLTLRAVKLATVIGDLRAGRPGRVQPWEASAIAEVLGPGIGAAAAVAAGDVAGTDRVPDDAPFEFRFPWSSGSTRTRRTGTATALAGVSEVDPADAPVACSLRTAAGRLEVRRLGSWWLRPVLSPGSWEPVTVAGLRRAAGGDVAWRDNPFLPRSRGGCPDFHLDDRSTVRAVTHADGRRLSQARDACLARAGELLVIDGVVHRSTTAPVAGVCTVRQDGRTRSCAAWVMGDLASTCSMDTLARRDTVVLTWSDGRSTPDPAGGHDPDGTFVSLSDWAGVVRLMPGVASGLPTYGASSGGATGLPREDDLVWVADAGASAPDGRTCLDAAVTLAERLLPVRHRPDRTGAPAGALVGLREALSRMVAARDGAGEGSEQASVAVRRSCEDVADLPSKGTDPRDDMWVYVASLASHAAGPEIGLRDDVDELLSIRF